MKQLKIWTPAKLNAPLKILFKRDDGFHEIDTQLIPVALFDCLELSSHHCLHFECSVNFQEAQESNLVVRALRLFEQELGQHVCLKIKLHKQIPHQAGLGGGSGNAAGTLIALNRWHGYPLSSKTLLRLAQNLGSDVPFFLSRFPCRVRGTGERLEVLHDVPEFPMIVIKPHFAISTQDAYQNCLPDANPSKFPSPYNLQDFQECFINDFEKTLFQDYPKLKEICQFLKRLGTAGALVSGSGSAVFGVFESYQKRDTAFKILQKQKFGMLFSTQTLTYHHYWRRT